MDRLHQNALSLQREKQFEQCQSREPTATMMLRFYTTETSFCHKISHKLISMASFRSGSAANLRKLPVSIGSIGVAH